MKPGEPDRVAVKILQEALIQAGFDIPHGATGFFGPETAAAVRAVERKHKLDLDEGVAGHQVITTLDALLTGRKPIATIRGADLQVLLQQANSLGGFIHRPYLEKAATLLDDFGLGLDVVDRRVPNFDFPPATADPSNLSDVTEIFRRAEKRIPGSPDRLRVILCRFGNTAGASFHPFGSTAGGVFPLADGSRVQDFVLIDVGRRRTDDCVLIHELIHATGLVTHDTDSDSVFSVTSSRSVLKPEHAERLNKAFFARIRH